MSYLSVNYDAIKLGQDSIQFQENWIVGDYSQDYINDVFKCFDFCRPEIYFHNLFCILNKTDNETDEFIDVNMTHIDNFQNFCKSVFLRKCFIRIGDFKETDILESVNHDNILVKHFDAYFDSIEAYFNYNSNFSSQNDISDKDVVVEYFLNVMLLAYYITSIRLNQNISNEDLFSFDTIWHPNGSRLNIYFTPFALLNRDYVTKTFMKNPKRCLSVFFESVDIQEMNLGKMTDEIQIEIKIRYSGKFYCIQAPFKNPFYYINEYLQDILARNYLDFLKFNKLIVFIDFIE